MSIDEDPRIAAFRSTRPELFAYIKDKVHPFDNKFKLINAPVKSGKRAMVEIYSLLDKTSKHVFLTALHRRADEKQREEISSFGIQVYSVNNKEKKDRCITYIDELLKKNEIIKIHLDELDFGCGNKQLLNYIWNKYKSIPNVFFVLYSATIEVAKQEFLQVNNIEEFYECDRYIPPTTYYGISNFISNAKFFQAVPFIRCNNNDHKISVTKKGEELIKKLKDHTVDSSNKRHVAILRLAGNFKINGDQVSQFEIMKENKDDIEKEFNIRLRFVGSNDNTVEWDNQSYWEDLECTRPFLFIINQVSGRSTEWKCHPFLVWYHTLRTDETPTGTITQDQERPVHYVCNYTDEINIEIYGDLACAKYSAGLITLEEMLIMTSRKLNSRLDTKTHKQHVDIVYDMYESWDEIPAQYKRGKTLSTHVTDENILKPEMFVNEKKDGSFVSSKYKIANWDKHRHLENFYMTNIRSSRNKFIKGKSGQRPIWFKSDIMLDLNEGINEKSKIRINLYYDDGESNCNNYKFIVRRFNGSKEAVCSNTTMYNM